MSPKAAVSPHVEDDGEEYVGVSRAARLLHVSPATLANWAKAGKLPYVLTLGGQRRFPVGQLREVASGLARPSKLVEQLLHASATSGAAAPTAERPETPPEGSARE